MVSRRLSATGIRFSVILFPPGSWALLTVGLPAHTGPDLDGVTTFRTHEQRPGRAPSIPRGQRCSPRPRRLPAGRLPLRCGQSLHPATFPSTGFSLNEASTRVHAIRPVRSSPRLWPPGWNEPPLGFPPGLRTPPTRSRTTHAEVGTGHRARTWNYTLNITSSISNPVVHSMRATSCRTSPKRSRDATWRSLESDRADGHIRGGRDWSERESRPTQPRAIFRTRVTARLTCASWPVLAETRLAPDARDWGEAGKSPWCRESCLPGDASLPRLCGASALRSARRPDRMGSRERAQDREGGTRHRIPEVVYRALPSEGALKEVRRLAGSSATIESVVSLEGGQHAATWRVDTATPARTVVVRQFPAGDSAAGHEARVLRILNGLRGLAPMLLGSDLAGRWSECPTVLISWLDGEADITPSDPDAWGAQLGRALARVHATPSERRSALPSVFDRSSGSPERLDGPAAEGIRSNWPRIIAPLTCSRTPTTGPATSCGATER